MAVPSLATLRGLHEAGAWLVLYQDVPCRKPDKCKAVPVQDGWKHNRPGWELIEMHVRSGGAVGLIPASVGLVVVDVDTDHGYGADEVAAVVQTEIGAPVCNPVRTRSGGWHLYYRALDGVEIGNRTWHVDGAGGGDIRHASGFVRLYDPEAVAVALENLADYEPVDASCWPFRNTGDGGRPETARRVEEGTGAGRVAGALERLNPDCSREEWIKIGMSLHAGGLPLETWDTWSAGGMEYKAGECAREWETFNADRAGGVRLGTLYYLAGMCQGKRMKPRPRSEERRRRAAMRTLHGTGVQQALSPGRFSVLKQITWLSANERGYSYAGRAKIAKRAGLGVWWTAETLRYLVDVGLLVAHGKDDPDRYAPGRAPSCYSVDFERVEGYVSEWRAAAASRKAQAQAQTEKARATRAANRKADERIVEGNAMADETVHQDGGKPDDEVSALKDTVQAQADAIEALTARLDSIESERRRGPLSYPEAAAGLSAAPSKPEYIKTVIAGLYPTERVNGNVDVNGIGQALGTGTGGILKAIYEQWRRNPDPRLAVHNRLQKALN